MNFTEFVKERSDPNWRYHTGIFLKGRKICQDRQSGTRDLNPGCTKYKAEMLIICSIITFRSVVTTSPKTLDIKSSIYVL